MTSFRKSIINDPMKFLAENYFQCIYYLTTTDYGDGQDLLCGDTNIPEEIRVDEQDMLLIHSNIGVFNLHLINLPENDFLSKCIKNIVDIINSPNLIIPINELNAKLQQRVSEGW